MVRPKKEQQGGRVVCCKKDSLLVLFSVLPGIRPWSDQKRTGRGILLQGVSPPPGSLFCSGRNTLVGQTKRTKKGGRGILLQGASPIPSWPFFWFWQKYVPGRTNKKNSRRGRYFAAIRRLPPVPGFFLVLARRRPWSND